MEISVLVKLLKTYVLVEPVDLFTPGGFSMWTPVLSYLPTLSSFKRIFYFTLQRKCQLLFGWEKYEVIRTQTKLKILINIRLQFKKTKQNIVVNPGILKLRNGIFANVTKCSRFIIPIINFHILFLYTLFLVKRYMENILWARKSLEIVVFFLAPIQTMQHVKMLKISRWAPDWIDTPQWCVTIFTISYGVWLKFRWERWKTLMLVYSISKYKLMCGQNF